MLSVPNALAYSCQGVNYAVIKVLKIWANYKIVLFAATYEWAK
jgi:hypothetical protein